MNSPAAQSQTVTQIPASEPALLITTPLMASKGATVIAVLVSASGVLPAVMTDEFSSEHPMSSGKEKMHIKGLTKYDSASS